MHGKCISGESRLCIADGSVRTAEELFHLAQASGKVALDEIDKIIYDVSDKNICIFSLNKETGKLEKKNISHAWKLDGGEIIKIKLRNGLELRTTPEHNYVVLENNNFADKSAEELKLGDRIVCARRTGIESTINIKSYILKKLSEKNFYITLTPTFGTKLKNIILSEGIKIVSREINSDKKYKSLYHGIWQNRYNLKDLLNICDIFSLDLEEIYDEIDWIVYRSGKQRGKNSCRQKLPQNFEDLFYLAGLFVGDGSKHKFVVGKPVLAKRAIEILESMHIKYYLRNYANRTPEIGTNFTLLYILNSLFDYPLKKKSHNVKVSEFLFRSPKEFVAAFISGYFDCDGTVEKSRRAISLTSVSPQMLKDLQLLLLRFGCMSSVQRDTLYISGQSAKIFVKDIKFGLEEKQIKAENLAQTVIGSYVLDTVVIEGSRQFMLGNKVLNSKLVTGDLAFVEVTGIEATDEAVVYDFTIPDNHNFIAEGIVVHNTTLSDNLIAGAGMMSEELAGEQRVLDYDPQESARGITINAANITMIHNYDEKEYLINLIDTPGHVDFSGEVTRAMRAIDCAIVLVDAVEGIMPQTETVLRQSLKEGVKPVLFINKVDRLIKELKLPPEKMQEKFVKIIEDVNRIIESLAPKQFKQSWKVNVQNGTVCFGSAKHRWALSVPIMKKKNITLKHIIDAYQNEGDWKTLGRTATLHEAVLNMVVDHCPTPKEAQEYRIPIIWRGEKESETGKALLTADPNSDMIFVVTKVIIDPQAGEVFTGRVFSGTLKKGQNVILNTAKTEERIQQVTIYKGATRLLIDEAPAGNIVGVVGLKNAGSGETVSEKKITPFESIKHLFDPVVTVAIEPKNPQDLPKLIDVLKGIAKQDPTIAISINEETGENLLSGLGELHIEIWTYRIKHDKGLDVVISPPIVVYRESVMKKYGPVEGKSPNRHNKLLMTVEPLDKSIVDAIQLGSIPEGKIKKKKTDIVEALVEAGMDKDEARNVMYVHKNNVFVEATRGLVHLNEVIEMVLEGFKVTMDAGPIAKEPCRGLKITLNDAKLHEDSIHRGPGQMIPVTRQAISNAMLLSGVTLFEPIQTIRLDTPAEYLSPVTKLIIGRRGQLLETTQEGDHATVKAKLPVGEMFGFTSALRSGTAGRGAWFLADQDFEKLPNSLQDEIIGKLRKRKGLPENLPKAILD